MTIKEFAKLCGCNPQTLRYYDRVGLLKPVQVDRYSGYRFYDEEQAVTFVKTKNLQSALFTIDEIKPLLDADSATVYKVFDEKIASLESKLETVRAIQRSYQGEIDMVKEQLEAIRQKVTESMRTYDPNEQFDVDGEQYARITDNVCSFFESMLTANDADISYTPQEDGDEAQEEEEYADPLHDEGYTLVYEKHGWERVKDFLDEWRCLEDGAEYLLYFELKDASCGMPFANTILGILCECDKDKKKQLGCNVTDSKDGMNHFYLLKRTE